MKTYNLINTGVLNLVLVLVIATQIYAEPVQDSGFLAAYCASAVLKEALINLGISSDRQDKVIEELEQIAEQNKGFNSLYEIKLTAQKAGLKVEALKVNIEALRLLVKEAQVVANITGNRHFCLIKEITQEGVLVYIPGLNYEQPIIPLHEFLKVWDNSTILLINKKINLKTISSNYEYVSDEQLKEIIGGQPCANVTGGGGSYSGSGGSGRWSSGNESGESNSDSSLARVDPSTVEPVIIRNGNLSLTIEDISIPTRTLPLNLKRYYNSQVVSEVFGWLPEPGAGSWVIENGEYSGQGNRSTSDLKFKDFVLELDMQTIQPGLNHPWEVGWVNFRYLEDPSDPRKPKDCYYFLIHTDGKIELSKWENGTQYFLYNKYTSYRPTNKYRIKLEATGSNIKIYINGSLQINYTDSHPVLSEGRIALESYFSHAHFDNLKLTSSGKSYNYTFDTDDNEFIFGYGWTHS